MKFPMPLPLHLWLTTSKLIYKSHDQTQQIIEGFVLMMFVRKCMMINDVTISAHVSSTVGPWMIWFLVQIALCIWNHNMWIYARYSMESKNHTIMANNYSNVTQKFNRFIVKLRCLNPHYSRTPCIYLGNQKRE